MLQSETFVAENSSWIDSSTAGTILTDVVATLNEMVGDYIEEFGEFVTKSVLMRA